MTDKTSTDKAKWLSLMVALFVAFAAGVTYINDVKGDVDKVALSAAYNKESIVRLENDVKHSLDKIDQKLDRIIRER